MNTFTVRLVFGSALSGMAMAQRSTCDAGWKASVSGACERLAVNESVEHKVARQNEEKATQLYANKKAEIKEMMNRFHDASEAFAAIGRNISGLRAKVSHADECVAVYSKTIDKKRATTLHRSVYGSFLRGIRNGLCRLWLPWRRAQALAVDVTNREAEQIKACKSMGLYPPEKF